MNEETQRREEFLKAQDSFKQNAFDIITTMLVWCNQTQGSRHLVDEILHSIFFLGEINNPKYEPQDIISDEDMLNGLSAIYPGPLRCYKSQLPKRSPFSCVLDMVVLQKGRDNIDKIKQSLRELVRRLKEGFLVSSTVCVITCNTSNNKYYGVSMSTTGREPGRIVVAASCCSFWEEFVAGAVMTYYPQKAKKPYFDGTFKLPATIRCQAFNIRNDTPLNPCRSCGNLFGFVTSETQQWPYGNCAEDEAVSNLLKNERQIKDQARPTSNTYTPENRNRAERSVRGVLRQELNMVNGDFNWRNEEFYNPRG